MKRSYHHFSRNMSGNEICISGELAHGPGEGVEVVVRTGCGPAVVFVSRVVSKGKSFVEDVVCRYNPRNTSTSNSSGATSCPHDNFDTLTRSMRELT
eukprot:CAMPEP_0172156016 /NCGR_PEP_ID=MMETSP1050-20130122/2954_1 /TAXON_ID=233186 /ORGANISM="Cryptomonas curvata, Strain CCAP979/52" /LENGTH=96 /DNA_ID=CAMNT_0012824993 /DNA_START=300 /DNA_END=587 /DNA_ORIENTATION=+